MCQLVPDEETVLRRIFFPHHIHDDGRIKSAAFSPTSGTYCFSVNREAIASFKQVCNIGRRDEEKAKSNPGKEDVVFMGCLRALVGEIHVEKKANISCMLVLATPRRRLRSHADIQVPAKTIKWRKELRDIFSNLIPPASR